MNKSRCAPDHIHTDCSARHMACARCNNSMSVLCNLEAELCLLQTNTAQVLGNRHRSLGFVAESSELHMERGRPAGSSRANHVC